MMKKMMKNMMKLLAAVLLVMAAIIAVQMGLTYAFSFRIGEMFGKTAVTALFLYAIIRLVQEARRARA